MANTVIAATTNTRVAARRLFSIPKNDRKGISEFWNNSSKVDATEIIARMKFRTAPLRMDL